MGSTSREALMDDTTRAERLLSLFTSADRAAAMAGDLTEERRPGSFRFWIDVCGIVLAAWKSELTKAPLMVLMLTVAGCALLTAAAVPAVAAGYLIPHWSGSSWMAALFWWGG